MTDELDDIRARRGALIPGERKLLGRRLFVFQVMGNGNRMQREIAAITEYRDLSAKQLDAEAAFLHLASADVDRLLAVVEKQQERIAELEGAKEPAREQGKDRNAGKVPALAAK